jgi:hypothetical protein
MLTVGSEESITGAEVVRTALIVGLSAALAHASPVQAALYKCTGADGKVAYQDAPCPANASEQALKAKAPPPPPSPAAAARKVPAGSHTAAASKVDAATVAKSKKTADGKVAPEAARTKYPASAAPPAPDAAKPAAPPGK